MFFLHHRTNISAYQLHDFFCCIVLFWLIDCSCSSDQCGPQVTSHLGDVRLPRRRIRASHRTNPILAQILPCTLVGVYFYLLMYTDEYRQTLPLVLCDGGTQWFDLQLTCCPCSMFTGVPRLEAVISCWKDGFLPCAPSSTRTLCSLQLLQKFRHKLKNHNYANTVEPLHKGHRWDPAGCPV